MPSKLVGVSGTVKGQAFTLENGEISIGRDNRNTVVIKDLSISRFHCRLRRSHNSFLLEDLKSHNGTSVNGDRRQTPWLLKHRDHIQLGHVELLFLADENTESSGANRVEGDSAELIVEYDQPSQSTTRLSLTDAAYPTLSTAPRETPAAAPEPTAVIRLASDLETLVRVSSAISTIRDRQTLFTRLLQLIFEVTKADRAAIILFDEQGEQSTAAYTYSRTEGSGVPIKVSRTIVREVQTERVAILCHNLSEDPRFNESPSLIDLAIHSVICAPLVVFDRNLGIVYLDTQAAADAFTTNDLKLITAIVNQVAVAIDNIRYYERLENENRWLTEHFELKHSLIGDSPPMRQILDFIQRVAAKDSTVLITGESGTGKELIAHAIHEASTRRDLPFTVINCAAIPEQLLEAELFGHERGAFTGAVSQRKGKLELANHGTVFLDEIGELPLSLQAKLLRVLQAKEFERIGSNRLIKVDIRIIAATNRELEQAIKQGLFRDDLYYRLNVVSLEVPALRQRREDILLLAEHFLAYYSRDAKKRLQGFTEEARQAMLSYNWPGNVRELQNTIERAVVLGEGDWITLEDLPHRIRGRLGSAIKPSTSGYHQATRDFQRQIIVQAYLKAGGSLAKTAKKLKLNPTYLSRLLKKFNIQLPAKKSIKPKE